MNEIVNESVAAEIKHESLAAVSMAICTFCGCVCDDIEVTVNADGKSISKVGNACQLGKAWFTEHKIEDHPAALIDGKEASVAEAVEEAAQILVNAKFPLIYGLSDTTCEAQRQAVALADYLNGNIDTRSEEHTSELQSPCNI